MTYEMYRYIFLGTLIAACLMAVLSVVLFFVLKIPKVIGDLSGRTARKAIENIRRQNEESGDKTQNSGAGDQSRSRLTDKMTKSGRITPRKNTGFAVGKITEQLPPSQQAPNETTLLSDANQTTLLSDANQTTLLSDSNQTTVLTEISQTTVPDASTAVPEAPVYPAQEPTESAPVQDFVVEFEIVYIHTEEVIA